MPAFGVQTAVQQLQPKLREACLDSVQTVLEHEFHFVVAAVAQLSGHHRLTFRPAFTSASLLLAHPGYCSVCSTPHAAAQAAQDTHQDTHVGAAQKVN